MVVKSHQRKPEIPIKNSEEDGNIIMIDSYDFRYSSLILSDYPLIKANLFPFIVIGNF